MTNLTPYRPIRHRAFYLRNRHRSPLAKGMTMIELLVAMVISLLISLAAISALIVTRQGFTTVDVSSQLRDNTRFTADLIQRLGVQTGYKSDVYASKPVSPSETAANLNPNVFGFNNALISSSDPLNASTARTTNDGSDVLILRYQAAETYPGSGVSDGTMINCAGLANASTAVPISRDDRMASIFHLAMSQGEPALMCTYISATGDTVTQPIIQGVENFQVLYGVSNVTAATAPTAQKVIYGGTSTTVPGAMVDTGGDSLPDDYLRADQLTVVGDPVGTNNNWRRVRSLRIGMVLRGAINSQQGAGPSTFYPFGAGKSTSSSAKGSALSDATNDPGTVFTPTADGRMRLVSTFTVHLRNDQGL
jgi:type IV pilus assembly protein PilW